MKRPLQNILAMILGDVGSRLIGFLITVYLARTLEPSGFGVINIGVSVLGYLLLVGSPGIQVLEARNVAASLVVDRGRIGGVLSLRLLLAAILLLALTLVVQFVVQDRLTQTVIIFYALSLLPLAMLLDWYYQGKEDLLSVGVSKLMNYGAYGVCVWALVHSSADLSFTPVAFAVGNAVGASFLLLRYKREHGFVRLQWNVSLWKRILVENSPLGLATLLGQSMINLPPILIGLVLTVNDVGIFSAAMKMIFLFLLLDRVFNAIFLPVLARYSTQKPEEVPRLISIALKSVLLLAIPIAVIGTVLSTHMIDLVFGYQYSESAIVFAVLLGYFVSTLVNSVFVNTLIVSGREKKYTSIMFVSTLLLTICVFTGAAAFGLTGVAVGIVAAEVVTTVLLGLEAQRLVMVRFLSAIIRPFLAGVAMLGVAILFSDQNPILAASASLVTFITILIAIKGIPREEIRYLRERLV